MTVLAVLAQLIRQIFTLTGEGDERRTKILSRELALLLCPHMVLDRLVAELLDSICSHPPAGFFKIKDLFVAVGLKEIWVYKLKQTQLVGSDILCHPLGYHFIYGFGAVRLCKLKEEVTGFRCFNHPDKG